MPRFAQPEILLLASDEMCLSDVDVTRIGAVGRGIDQLSDRKRLFVHAASPMMQL